MKWCPDCGDAFDGNISECPFCGGALSALPEAELGLRSGIGETLAKWPRGEDGEPLPHALLTTVSTASLEDEALCAMLEAYGIATMRTYPNNGSLGRLILGTGAGVADIFVPAPLLEDAQKLLEQREAADSFPPFLDTEDADERLQ